MTDIPPPRREDADPAPARAASTVQPAEARRITSRRRAAARVSLIWAVPVIALVVILGLAWNAFSTRGPLIAVSFADATGITPGETTLKFREVTVGRVETVRFTPDLERVIVDIRVVPDIAEYIGESAQFWVVRPQVTTSGISRLDTVLSGTFIEGDWAAADDGPRPDVFTGMDRPPLIRSTDQGTWVVLSAPSAEGLTEGAPVIFRGIQVGRMENLHLSDSDESVRADVFVEAPHDRRLTTATVFWDVSGFSVSLGSRGVSVDVNSVATLLQGGAMFDTLASGGQPVQPGHVFRLYPDRDAAQAGSFSDDEPGQTRLTVLMPGDLRGLEKDAEVRLGGISVGRVTDLGVVVPEDGPEAGQTMQQVVIALSPSRLGLGTDAASGDVMAWLDGRVAQGMRARAASGGFMGLSLVIELAQVDDAPVAAIDMGAEPYPRMPVTDSDVTDIAGSAQGFLSRIGSLPLEETLKSVQDTANAITAIAASEDTRAVPAALRTTLEEASIAAAEIRAIAQELRAQAAAEKLATAFVDVSAAMDSVRIAADEVPDMVDKIEATADKVEAIDYERLGDSIQRLSDAATDLVQDLNAMLGSDDAAQLPANLSETLKSAAALLTELREGGAVQNLNATLESARAAADEARLAMAGLPDLTARTRAAIARAETVIAAYGERSAFNTELLALMREMRRASGNFGSLARMIERNPRAFILGR